MKFVTVRADGAVELREQSEIPPGVHQLTDAEYAQLIGGYILSDGQIIIKPAVPPDYPAEKTAMLAQARLIRETVLNRLTGIQVNTADAPTIAAIQAARLALLNITADAGVVAAADGTSTKVAIMSAWRAIALTLAAASPSAASVFVGLGM